MKPKPAVSVLEDARTTFAAESLTLPPVPERFASEIKKTRKWCYASRPVEPMAMYFFEQYLIEALTGAAPDYVAFSHAGYRINSYSLNYSLVDGPLVILVQTPYGGGYSTSADDFREAHELFERCSALIAAAAAAKDGLARRHGRLYILESQSRQTCAWGRCDSPLEGSRIDSWLEKHSV